MCTSAKEFIPTQFACGKFWPMYKPFTQMHEASFWCTWTIKIAQNFFKMHECSIGIYLD